MSVKIINFTQLIQSTTDSGLVKASKLRQIIRVLWSVLCITGSAYGIEEITVEWPTISSMVLPAYLVLALVILYVGHLCIDLVIDTRASVDKIILILKNADSSNNYFMLNNLKDVSAKSRYKESPIEILVSDNFQIVRNTLSTMYGEYRTQPLIGTAT